MGYKSDPMIYAEYFVNLMIYGIHTIRLICIINLPTLNLDILMRIFDQPHKQLSTIFFSRYLVSTIVHILLEQQHMKYIYIYILLEQQHLYVDSLRVQFDHHTYILLEQQHL